MKTATRLVAAFRAMDPAAANDVVHPEVEMDASRSGVAGLHGVYRGLQEVGRFWQAWLEAWGSITFDAELIDAGDRVVSLTSIQRLRGKGSGVEVGISNFGWVMEFRDGKVARATLYMDKEQALEAAGLSE